MAFAENALPKLESLDGPNLAKLAWAFAKAESRRTIARANLRHPRLEVTVIRPLRSALLSTRPSSYAAQTPLASKDMTAFTGGAAASHQDAKHAFTATQLVNTTVYVILPTPCR